MDKFPTENKDNLWELIWKELERYNIILELLAGFWNNKQKDKQKNKENPKILPIPKEEKHEEKEVVSSKTPFDPDDDYEDDYDKAVKNIKEDYYCKPNSPPNSPRTVLIKEFKLICDHFNADNKDHHKTEKDSIPPIKGENKGEQKVIHHESKTPKGSSLKLLPFKGEGQAVHPVHHGIHHDLKTHKNPSNEEKNNLNIEKDKEKQEGDEVDDEWHLLLLEEYTEV
uniref:Uncharacterized protein n=1 Tax=Meloidogyne hapla TaxID=6305 RepID=A0A1I8B2W1_MELHA